MVKWRVKITPSCEHFLQISRRVRFGHIFYFRFVFSTLKYVSLVLRTTKNIHKIRAGTSHETLPKEASTNWLKFLPHACC